ncbi:hypothetical protein AIOGIFDO_00704 [Candidatus Methanoperedenaceae archaeon GB37]|nr:hypothetical protein AIOGIFDO_00704 [Candidatus Methanoperedenaceae archaeon GB37]
MVVKHVTGRMKRLRITADDEFRNRPRQHDTTTSIMTGLVNFHLIVEKGI